jgi:hypothetical protein
LSLHVIVKGSRALGSLGLMRPHKPKPSRSTAGLSPSDRGHKRSVRMGLDPRAIHLSARRTVGCAPRELTGVLNMRCGGLQSGIGMKPTACPYANLILCSFLVRRNPGSQASRGNEFSALPGQSADRFAATPLQSGSALRQRPARFSCRARL